MFFLWICDQKYYLATSKQQKTTDNSILTKTQLGQLNFLLNSTRTIMKSLKFALALGALAFSLNSFAQDDEDDFITISIGVSEHAIVDIEGGNNISLSPSAPTEAGDSLDFSTAIDTSTFLNYSSIKNSGGSDATRDIYATMTGTLPAGLSLTVRAGVDLDQGAGDMGVTTGAQTMDGNNQNVLTGIGSAYTGDGTENGHRVYYSLSLASGTSSYKDLDQDNNQSVVITYTITDN